MMQVIDTGAGFRLMGFGDIRAMCWQVVGDLDIFRSGHLKEVVEGSVRAGCLHHTVDLTQANSLDASGIRQLIGLHKLLGDRGLLRIRVNSARQPGQLLASTGASRILNVAERG